MPNHPVDTAAAVGGMALTAISSAGEGAGTALDATGVGATAGVPSTSSLQPASPSAER